MPDNTIILDLRKIETGEHFDKYCKDLFAPIQHKTPEENRVLEADLYRSKIIIDIDGQRKICSSIQEFLDNSTMLTDDQHTYITNIGHQGLFGGGSAVMPVSFVACMPQDIIMQDTRSIANTLTDDVALCVYVKDGKVTLANTIQYKLTNIDGVEPKGNVTLSMVADITNVKKGSERETPIHMVISQPNVGTNIIHAIREAEPDAVIVSHDQKDHHFINTVRQDKARDNEITLQPFIRDTSDIDKLAAQNLDDSKPLIFRQTALNQALHELPQIQIDGSCSAPEMSAKIYRSITSIDPNKEALRAIYASKSIVKHPTPSAEVVSQILNSVMDDGPRKNILMKNASMISRQAVHHKNLSFKDRVRKVFDSLAMLIIPEKRVVKNFVSQLQNEKKQAKAHGIERV